MEQINKYVEAFKTIDDFPICKDRVLAELKWASITNAFVEDFIPEAVVQRAEKNMNDTKDVVLSVKLRSLLDVVTNESSVTINSIYTCLVGAT